jgi:hypothetical protein
MRVLACYAEMAPGTREALEKYAPEAEFVYVGDHDEAYWQALNDAWTGDDDLVIIEQDIEITADVLPSFQGCKQHWCSYAYTGPRNWAVLTSCLGCTKFSAALQRAFSFPDMVSVKHWEYLDVQVAAKIQQNACILSGVRNSSSLPHVHGRVNHLHDYGDCIPEFRYGTDLRFDAAVPRLYRQDNETLVPVLPKFTSSRRWWHFR